MSRNSTLSRLARLHRKGRPFAGLPVLMLLAGFARAADPPAPADPAASDLAKQLSNPVASLVSVPFQMNWDTGVGPDNDTRFTINFQPVMPFALSTNWNLIARVIVPIVNQPPLAPGAEATSGVSDILFSSFFSPAHPKGVIWGVGPAILLPTTSDPYLGGEKWCAGPTIVLLKQSGHWTYGGLANQVWSFAGDVDRADINSAFFQPFLVYGTSGGTSYTINTESTANWDAPSGEQWTVPINFTLSKVVKLGKKPLSVALGYGTYVDSPPGGPEWKLRSTITLLFPTK